MRLILALLLGSMLYLPGIHTHAADVELVTVDYSPYYGPDLPNGGPITEIVTEAFRKFDYETSIKYVPWARALSDAKAGKADGLHGAWYSKEREQWFAYSDKLPGNEIVLYKRKGSEPQSFTGFTDLKPYKIGVVREYRNPVGFDAAKLRVQEANSDKLNLTKLANKRIDLILIDRALANYILSNELAEYKDELEAVEPPLEIAPLYVLISKETDDFQQKIDALNKGLKALAEEGRVEEIMMRHNLQ